MSFLISDSDIPWSTLTLTIVGLNSPNTKKTCLQVKNGSRVQKKNWHCRSLLLDMCHIYWIVTFTPDIHREQNILHVVSCDWFPIPHVLVVQETVFVLVAGVFPIREALYRKDIITHKILHTAFIRQTKTIGSNLNGLSTLPSEPFSQQATHLPYTCLKVNMSLKGNKIESTWRCLSFP